MNPLEIEAAVIALVGQPFDAAEFPFAFLAAFGNKETTIRRLRAGQSNHSDVPGGVLQRRNIHIATCAPGMVDATLASLRDSPATSRQQANFILATDGEQLVAEYLGGDGEALACPYAAFADHFAFFLPLAGISTVAEIRNSSLDIRATSRLNRLYTELLRENPDWARAASRHRMNHFMARLIFCFFAEDTGIFPGTALFSTTVQQMGGRDAADVHEVIGEIFRAMDCRADAREAANIRPFARAFPYVNGALFAGETDVPRFSRMTRSYLLQIAALDWRKINPDIFGSMIQAIAEDEERGNLGMHYTSVPNILKLLGPLFLDELHARLEEADDNGRKLLNLKNRLATIRLFDPACGSGNFLVIAYKELRRIEAEINRRRGEEHLQSVISVRNFRGIELRDFAAEIARLALIIAEFQADVLYRGEKLALAEFLPLKADNWITCGNALALDWLALMDEGGSGVRLQANDLFGTPPDQAEIDFEHAPGETYICGNPPYLGSTWQSAAQKAELQQLFDGRARNWKSLDYVAGWFLKAADYIRQADAAAAFVATNSICQGQQVAILWPLILHGGVEIAFAHSSFKWANLAKYNAGVTVAIVGLSRHAGATRALFETGAEEQAGGQVIRRDVANINAYLVPGGNVIVKAASRPLGEQADMTKGDQPTDGGNLLLSAREISAMSLSVKQRAAFLHPFLGSAEFIRGLVRYALWIEDAHLAEAMAVPALARRIEAVRQMRLASPKTATRKAAETPHRFGEIRQSGTETVMIVPSVSSESRAYLPVGYEPAGTIVSNLAFALYDAPLWNLALIASRLHLVWIATVCGKLKTDFRYSNTLGWNTFPLPPLTDQNRADLTAAAETILLAREAHFPATIADLYAEGAMPENLRAAHDRNDETVERIFIGRRFKNDSERLEHLFERYAARAAKGTKA